MPTLLIIVFYRFYRFVVAALTWQVPELDVAGYGLGSHDVRPRDVARVSSRKLGLARYANVPITTNDFMEIQS